MTAMRIPLWLKIGWTIWVTEVNTNGISTMISLASKVKERMPLWL
jgi:hypothetical protein